MPSDDANFSTPLGGWKVSALHSTFLRGKCERFWTLPAPGFELAANLNSREVEVNLQTGHPTEPGASLIP